LNFSSTPCELTSVTELAELLLARTELAVAVNISRVALYGLPADRTEKFAFTVETCFPSHCIATVAARINC
jgi:hypothetical protein